MLLSIFLHFKVKYVHFYSFDFNTPRVGGFVKCLFHDVADGLPFREDFCQVLRAKNVSQSCCCQQMRRVTEINFNIIQLLFG